MRKVIFILSVIFFTSCKLLDKRHQLGYKIYKIETLNSYYIVYCEKDNKKYKIVSKGQYDNTFGRHQKIKTGKAYNFILNSYKTDGINNNPLTNTGTTPYVIQCHMFDNETKICTEPDQGIYNLHYTTNLVGLRYRS